MMRSQAAHFLVQETDGVVLLVVGAKRVRADQFGEQCSLVGRGFAEGTHLVKHGRHAERCDLPRSLRTSQPAADDVHCLEAFVAHGTKLCVSRERDNACPLYRIYGGNPRLACSR